MLRSLRTWCAVSTFAIAVLGPGSLAVAGDDGPPPQRADRPTRTVLRPIEVPDLAQLAVPVSSAKEAIVLVAGINSSPQDATFDPLIAQLFGDPRYEIYRFGADPRYPYDALGDLDTNARNLRDEIRAIGATHPAVHIVAHSMGGAVTDRAFSAGLSANDGVATYVALSSPHSGTPVLAATEGVLKLAGDSALEIRAAFSPAFDPGSDAAHDLARTRPVPPPPGVVRLDLRMSTDWAVTARDATDPGVESRTLVPSDLRGYIDGHGSVTRDPQALRLITSTIADRAIPVDRRSWMTKLAANRQSNVALGLALLIAGLGVIGACCIYLAAQYLPVRWFTRPLAEKRLLAAHRK